MDYAAATPTDPRVITAMQQCLSIEGCFANPHAKDHVYGWEAAEAVETARSQIAELVGASPLEIIFTSGATESNNLAILGLARALRQRGDKRRRVITSKIEHKAVLEACELLEEQGYSVTYLKPREDGIITLEQLKESFSSEVFLVTLAQANSVLGSVSDVHALAAFTHQQGAYFHTDTAQSAGYVRTDFANSQISLASLTSEKVCGPKGVGALYIKRAHEVPLVGLIFGGGQEKGLRGGTVATHQVVGMGKAFEILQQEGRSDALRMLALRRQLRSGLSEIAGVQFNGSLTDHVPGILSVSFADLEGPRLITSLSDTACSTGSACSSADLKPSYVLKAIGLSDALARASLRLSLGRFTTEDEITRAVTDIQQTVARLRADKIRS
ncbi:MAG: aminotransferase class V-fold PLP-dependent enzyme [Succinivibrio sp.]|nr:aminotransferase class V-fold PLP-dependent enzyme [Succinivibrio sp.]